MQLAYSRNPDAFKKLFNVTQRLMVYSCSGSDVVP